jgi:hypothetical protein
MAGQVRRSSCDLHYMKRMIELELNHGKSHVCLTYY